MATASTGVREVKSAARTIEVLEFLATRQGSQTRLRDVSDGLGAPRSSTYAILQTLVTLGWVATDPSGTLYSIGIRALLAGTSYLDRDPRIRLVSPILADVSQDLGETLHLARLDGDQVVYLATAESREYARLLPRVGRRLFAVHTSLGKAILAERPDAVPSEMPPPPLPASISDRAALDADLDATRARGYAIDEEENTPGLRCFGFALHYDIPVSDAMSCSVPLARLTPGREEAIVAAMERARRRIEESAPVAVA